MTYSLFLPPPCDDLAAADVVRMDTTRSSHLNLHDMSLGRLTG
jgi:hypothetical protein